MNLLEKIASAVRVEVQGEEIMSEEEIHEFIVQDYNLTTLQANRIAKTTMVVISFDGNKVLN
ncbi:hypothetical protein HPB48_027016 [Haemaphysalis longicornis]|uniref:Uncharacterized protein n=1 Tax=Haemaphysalis longicornis TaxID=44386 RepID=A0A9J6HCA0_HAELO|nr:hypothetical protein HPB48_027016 [Haemaphysalis longicornis]